MSRAKQFLACMVVVVLFACFLDVVGLPDHTHNLDHDSIRLIKVVVELLLVAFAVVITIVERISRKLGDGLPTPPPGHTELPPESSQAPMVVSPPQPRKKHSCLCGYDLRANPNEWMQFDGETPERCPDCSRQIYRDDYGESEPKKLPDAVEVRPDSQSR